MTCNPTAAGWTFQGTNGDGGHVLQPALNGCAEGPVDVDGSQLVRIGNHYPYPYLLDLPAAVVGPAVDELLEADDPLEALIGFFWTQQGRAVLPAGNDISVRYRRDAAPTTTIKGSIDPSTLVLRALALAAAFATRGESVQIKAAIKIELRTFLALRRTLQYSRHAVVLGRYDGLVILNPTPAGFRHLRHAPLGDR